MTKLAVKTSFVMPYTPEGKTNIPILRYDKKQSGVYLIKNDKTDKIVYVGYSEGRLYDTIYRHFQKWTDIQRAVKTRFTYPKHGFSIRIIFTTPLRASNLEKYLIMKMQPPDNDFKYKNYLSAVQEKNCSIILDNAPLISIHDNNPF